METTRLWLVRHGHAAHGWGDDPDPGLDALGRAQAVGVADLLAGGADGRPGSAASPVAVLSSPLRRARETAAPLAARWATPVVVTPAVSEIPAPSPVLADRAGWLDGVLASRWSELEAPLPEWREDVLRWVRTPRPPAVVFTHFVFVNVVVGAATGDDRVVCELVANGSVTAVVVHSTGVIELSAR